jgi:hypothetical protein
VVDLLHCKSVSYAAMQQTVGRNSGISEQMALTALFEDVCKAA